MKWQLHVPGPRFDITGFLEDFFSEAVPLTAAQQAGHNYIGGWNPIKGFTVDKDNRLCFPGDPKMTPLATATLRQETIRLYESGWVTITQPDGSFEVSRMD